MFGWRKSFDSKDFDDELQTHLSLLTDRFIRQGMPPTTRTTPRFVSWETAVY